MTAEPVTTNESTTAATRPTVAIIGAGFAGIYAAKVLRDAPVRVVLIDQHNYHTFQPLLYQVATSLLEAEEISRAVRGVFRRQANLHFRQGTVTDVDLESRRVLLSDGGEVHFDYVIVGTGTIYNDFGTPGVREHGLFLKSLSEAVNLRAHILNQFERVSVDPGLADKGALNFVIVGGGATGVEMAGSMMELFERVLPKDFPELDIGKARVILVEMADSLLGPFAPRLREYTERVLSRRGVDVRTNTAVKEVRPDAVVLGDGEEIPTHTVLWAAGVRAHPLLERMGIELTRGFRAATEANLSLPGHPFAFVAGDASGTLDDEGRPFPQVAQVAIQQGRHAAREVLRALHGQPSRPFVYRDKGSMAIIARNAGIAQLSPRFFNLKLTGFLGWLGWLFVHLVYLPGHRNRFGAIVNWASSYLTYERHARLIANMTPSPAEVANRTLEFVDYDTVAGKREEAILELKTRPQDAAAAEMETVDSSHSRR